MGAKDMPTWLVELPRERCQALLGTSELGRLGVVSDGRPEVYPICHVYLDGVIAFPTNVGTKMHSALTWPFVAFEVDGIDEDGLTGWSVMVRGKAEEVEDPLAIERYAAARQVPWRTTPSLRWVRIIPMEISGRQIFAVRPLRDPGSPPG